MKSIVLKKSETLGGKNSVVLEKLGEIYRVVTTIDEVILTYSINSYGSIKQANKNFNQVKRYFHFDK